MNAPGHRGLLSSIRGLATHGLDLLLARFELLATELEEEKQHLLNLLAYGAAAFILLGAGILFLAIFLTVLFWEEHRLLTLGVFTAVFLTGGIVALVLAIRHAQASRHPFSESLAELRQDRAELAPDE